MGAPLERDSRTERGWGEEASRLPVALRLNTCIVIEHPKAVSVVVPEELSRYDVMVLLDHLHILLIEGLPEPCLVLRLLKEPWGHVANDVHL